VGAALSVNLLTNPSQASSQASQPSRGRLAALRGAQSTNDLVTEDDSFESQRSAHDFNSARRGEALPFRPTDRNGHRDPRRDGPHSSYEKFNDDIDDEEREEEWVFVQTTQKMIVIKRCFYTLYSASRATNQFGS
jgi:hypothetical protein